MSIEKVVQYYKYRDFTGSEISEATGRQPILFSDLGKYKSLDQLLGKYGYVIILLQTSNIDTGHWVAITKGSPSGKYRWMDPYGINPLIEVQDYVPFDAKMYPNYIKRLFKNVSYEYNSVDYQSKHRGISTCGAWATIFVKLRHLDLNQINAMFRTNSSAFLQDSDNTACLLTLLIRENVGNYTNEIDISKVK